MECELIINQHWMSDLILVWDSWFASSILFHYDFFKQKDELFISNQKIFQQNLKVQSITFQHVSHHKSMHFIPVIILLYGMFYSFGQSKSEMHSGIYTHTYCTKFSTSTCILHLWEQKKKLQPWQMDVYPNIAVHSRLVFLEI